MTASLPIKSNILRDTNDFLGIEKEIFVDGLKGLGKFCDKFNFFGSTSKFSRSVPVRDCAFDCAKTHGKRKFVLYA